MSYDFYVLEGKKLIDYKPKAEHYRRALSRMIEKSPLDFMNNKEELKKFIFMYVKRLVLSKAEYNEYSYEKLNEMLQFMFMLTDLMGRLTPTEFMQMFPIPKEYYGEEIGVKDYFSTIKDVMKYPLDKPIGVDNITQFIVDYYNWDVMIFEVTKLSIISKIRRMNGKKGVMEEFMEMHDLSPRIMHQEGNYMVDNETGERLEIAKPKHPMRKLFSVVE